MKCKQKLLLLNVLLQLHVELNDVSGCRWSCLALERFFRSKLQLFSFYEMTEILNGRKSEGDDFKGPLIAFTRSPRNSASKTLYDSFGTLLRAIRNLMLEEGSAEHEMQT